MKVPADGGFAMRIVVLGCGHQGGVVASELATDFDVTVADVKPVSLARVAHVERDLSNFATVRDLLSGFDLAVGALPAALGFTAARAAIAARRNYVDLSFYSEDVYSLDTEARQAGITIVPDCGLAPGISNLVVGRAVAFAPRRKVCIEVGGVSEDPAAPYGYVVSWALSDLMDEYTRPARLRRGGKVVALPAFSELEPAFVDGLGPFESFLTDGCRTLLRLDVPDLEEKTLRWPGHVQAVQPLLANGTLHEELRSKCQKGADLVVMKIRVDEEETTLVTHPRAGLSAMARCTALTCAAFVRLLASGFDKRGVVAPEAVGADLKAFSFIMERLRHHEIVLKYEREKRAS
jgi:lysine 6-dehydrogenase